MKMIRTPERRLSKMELKQIFEVQKTFDRRMHWNRYEECKTTEEILDFMKYYIMVTVEELGEICRIRKDTERDNKGFDVKALKHELVDLFVYLMQACMAVNMDLEKEYLTKMKQLEERFSVC